MSHPKDLDGLIQEFLGRPEGRVEDGALVVRPSLRVALARFLMAFLSIFALATPLIISFLIEGGSGSRGADALFLLFEVGFQFLFPALFAFAPAIQIIFTRYVFDEDGVRERVQILSKTEKRVQWAKVTALRHRRTLFDRLFGIERVDIIAYGERGTTLHLVGLRKAPEVRNLVSAQMRQHATMARLFQND